MAKFKVGDKVRIRKDLVVKYYDSLMVCADMLKQRGEISEIKYVYTDGIYNISISNYLWNDAMLEDNILAEIKKDNEMKVMPQKEYDDDAFKEEPSNVEEFSKICESMVEIYEKKNADYGNSFDMSLDNFGLTAAAIRLSDKINRLKSIVKKDNIKVTDESLRDTLMDAASYSIMTIMWMDKNNLNK